MGRVVGAAPAGHETEGGTVPERLSPRAATAPSGRATGRPGSPHRLPGAAA
ncbi:hypothetical protein FB380_002413 [Modestobacter marinus]|uniref:Uncharacterized protein n=1 Tax=Modestobacter marinus TaxID=477641 RepID=A0A846LKC4_9ACTN|nr:hypothetical protein [Modestobacter marinus]